MTSLVKQNRPRFTDVEGLAAMVGGGDVFGVGGHHFARLPIALLRAIARLGVKDLRYVCWAGGLPLELLLEANAVAAVDICFSSLDIFGLPPRFRAAAETNAVPVRDWTALAMIQALRAGQQNLPSMPFSFRRVRTCWRACRVRSPRPIRSRELRPGSSRPCGSIRSSSMPSVPTRAAMSRSSDHGRWISPWPARRARCW
ncbi:CoA-transferase [Mesorhizobium sp. M0910]|uniref:CoA-transferase n=1 Tax=Mesorhizobium sp. M0910 TaxID=2957025 RepID=UPI00333537F1